MIYTVTLKATKLCVQLCGATCAQLSWLDRTVRKLSVCLCHDPLCISSTACKDGAAKGLLPSMELHVVVCAHVCTFTRHKTAGVLKCSGGTFKNINTIDADLDTPAPNKRKQGGSSCANAPSNFLSSLAGWEGGLKRVCAHLHNGI